MSSNSSGFSSSPVDNLEEELIYWVIVDKKICIAKEFIYGIDQYWYSTPTLTFLQRSLYSTTLSYEKSQYQEAVILKELRATQIEVTPLTRAVMSL